MNWFDKLFSDEDDEEVYQRKYSQRRQKLEEKERRRHALLPENNDIYDRPKGNFRFPLHVNDSEQQTESESESNHSEPTYESEEFVETSSHQKPDRRHRRRRAFYDDDTPSFRSSRNTRKQSEPKERVSEQPNKKESHNRRVQNYSTRYDTKDIYYKSGEFRAEEVPSAIFGTKKRHPLENGVIQRSDAGSEEEPKKQQEKIPTDPLNGMRKQASKRQEAELYESEEVKSENDQAPSESSQHQVKQTPNYSKADNTININNIYASQIVEEIRRERERKVLQRKKFKEALQQKREQEDVSSIQKAIDEMYAEQAKQYVEDPVFQENGFEKEKEARAAEYQEEETQHTSDEVETNVSEEAVTQSQNDFDYEEVDLNQVQNVQQINEQDVKVVEDAPEEAHQLESESHQSESVELTEAPEPLPEVSEAQYTEIDDEDKPVESEQEQEKQVHLTDVHESTEDEQKSEETVQETKDESETVQESSEPQEENPTEVHEPVLAPDSNTFKSETAKADETKEEVTEENEKSSLEPKLRPEQPKAVEEENEASIPETKEQHEESVEQEETAEKDAASEQIDNEQEENKVESEEAKSEQPKVSRPIRKGAKPFNVMMTPSDKRRMMDAQKRKAAQTPKTQTSDSKVVSSPEQSDVSQTTNVSTQDESEAQSSQHEGQTTNQAKTEQGHITTSVQTAKTTQSNTQETSNQPVTEQNGPVQAHHEGIRKGPNLKLPSLDLLDEPEVHEVDQEWIDEKKEELNDAFYYFNVPAEVKNVTEGPSVTRFELSVEKGVKVSRITALHDDLKMALAAKDIRIEAPIPGTSLVGIEVPNVSPTKVNLKSIIESPQFKNAESKLTVAMGNRINNEPLLMDIAKTPHALIAGATGSGKSVCINSILLSLLYKNHPEELKLLLIDPKMVELAPYNGLPHLVSPVITDVKAATQSLKWAVDEMERRYKLFAQYHVRNITAFNKKASYEQRLPKIVIVIDELADLMMMAPQEVEQSIARIAQKARACGIHMLVATQRPSVNVITGLIKANIPTRIAFMVSSSVDSRTILDSGGAERLLGYGDMLYLGNGMNKPIRVQGSFVSDEEIDAVVDFIKAQREPEYLFEEKELLKQTKAQPKDELFDDVCRFMVAEGNISTSLIQRHFQIGYNRAARIVDQLEALGYISGSNGSKPREVYLTAAEINEE
ncbi:DNA translocase FtsK [Staphylococcus simulans]|uniref:DNA translocase FtsK n=1 Tax=Staphylococcus simulans TaxID=1286 RepID=UPI000E68EB31|nr:DNA translocase FtsK [Staphylococcus simulans]RIN76982.1 DNA translocase FtsK [Staphylococcus simulans]